MDKEIDNFLFNSLCIIEKIQSIRSMESSWIWNLFYHYNNKIFENN